MSLSRVVVWYKSDRGPCPPPSFAVTLRKEFPKSALVAHEGVIGNMGVGAHCHRPVIIMGTITERWRCCRDESPRRIISDDFYNLLVIGTSTKIKLRPAPPQMNEPPLPNPSPSDYKKDAMAWILGCIGIFVLTTVVAGFGVRYALSRKNGRARKYDEAQQDIIARSVVYLEDDIEDLPKELDGGSWNPINSKGPILSPSGTRKWQRMALSLTGRLGSKK